MLSFLNPYTLIGGGILALSLGGTIYFQSKEIHHFHKLYNCAQYAECDKDFKGDTIPALRGKIIDMTAAQNTQTGKSESAVIKVVQGPREVQSIIREINAAPVTKDCKVAPDSEDIQNAF